ncbi:MAG: GGDEF domain-containing protein, partial [Ardenticatenia bacterium]
MLSSTCLNQPVPRDVLTGAYAREGLPVIWQTLVSQGHIALCFFDIDYFKSINDAFGHHVGDEVLRHVVSVVGASVRQNDVLVRYAGDEFVLLMPGIGFSEAHLVAERVLAQIQATPFVADGRSISLTLSMGLALFPEEGDTLEQVLRLADERTSRAKQTGRAQVVSRDDYHSFRQMLEAAWLRAHEEAVNRFRAWLLSERSP